MNLKTQRGNEVLVVKVEGRLDGSSSRDFEVAISGAIDNSDKAVIVDLSELSYVSSAGLRAFSVLAQTVDAKFILCSLPDAVREVIEISGFHKILPIYASRAAAFAEALKDLDETTASASDGDKSE